MDTVRVFIGFDQREAAAYHVCCQSLIEHAKCRLSIHPLAPNMPLGFDGQKDGTNAFTVARYLIPWMCDFTGKAIFIDGDMVVNSDIGALWDHWQFDKAVCVVKHDYRTRHPRKYVGSKLENVNVDYPRKNWASVMLFDCAHFANRVLLPEYVGDKSPQFLHRFGWLKDEQIGDLASTWNHLVGEDAPADPRLAHFTLGVPGIRHYADDALSWRWHRALVKALECAGEPPGQMVQRAEERIGAV